MIPELEQLFRELLAQRKTLEDLLATGRAGVGFPPDGKKVLAQLAECLDRIRLNRTAWVRLDPVEKRDYPEITELLRGNQNLIMKILVLDRENQQAQSSIGKVGQVSATPVANRPRRDFLSSLYRRNSGI